MNKVETKPSQGIHSHYKMDEMNKSENTYQMKIINQLLKILERIIIEQVWSIRHWNIREKLSWAYGFTFGDGSIQPLIKKRGLSVEVSYLCTPMSRYALHDGEYDY